MNPKLPVATLRRLAPGLLLIAALLLLFRETATAMVNIWIRSETFAHAFLVPPIVIWMIWRRRATLATLQPRAAPWLLLPMALVCLAWLVGELASSNAVTQMALVTLLVLSVPAVFGLQVANALLFPLLFLFFAVPVGEFMVPYMMQWTADFTVAALQLSGLPVFREGLQFVIPSGNWSVVEACSGVRYLIASFMVGTLFAYLNYRSPTRRAIFMVISLLVPIIANWLRAYLIVMLGHFSGNSLAVGADHLIYGWVFFGIVIGVMFFIGGRFAEPDEAEPVAAARMVGAQAGGAGTAPWVVGASVLLLLVITQGVNWQLNRAGDGPAPTLALPAGSAGWSDAQEPVSAWQPFFGNASVNRSRSYTHSGASVGLWVAYYRDQGYDRKLVSSTNALAEPVPEATWAEVESGAAQVSVPGGTQAMRTAVMRGSQSPDASQAQRLRVWHIYWVGGRYTTSKVKAKLMQAANRLLGRGDDGAALFFYTIAGKAEDADELLGRFVQAHFQALSASLEATRGAR